MLHGWSAGENTGRILGQSKHGKIFFGTSYNKALKQCDKDVTRALTKIAVFLGIRDGLDTVEFIEIEVSRLTV